MPAVGAAVMIGWRGRSAPRSHAMSTEIPSWPATGQEQRESRWARWLTEFAAAIMIVAGVCHALAGIAALLNDEVYAATPQYIYKFDLTAWGWIHLLLGVV